MPTHYQGSAKEVRALNAFIKLARASDSLLSRLNPLLSSYGLTASQFGVLETLLHVGPLNQSEIAEKLLKSGGNITMVVDNLEKRDLVIRTSGTKDRRITIVDLSPSGRALIKEVFPKHVNNIVHEFSVLEANEQEELGRLCRVLGLGATNSEDPKSSANE